MDLGQDLPQGGLPDERATLDRAILIAVRPALQDGSDSREPQGCLLGAVHGTLPDPSSSTPGVDLMTDGKPKVTTWRYRHPSSAESTSP